MLGSAKEIDQRSAGDENLIADLINGGKEDLLSIAVI